VKERALHFVGCWIAVMILTFECVSSERKSPLKFLNSGERCVATIKWFSFARAWCNCREQFQMESASTCYIVEILLQGISQRVIGCTASGFVLACCVLLDVQPVVLYWPVACCWMYSQ
jgi:hypothetical protein